MAKNTVSQATVITTVNGQQAEKQLTVLSKKAADLRKRMDEANQAGDQVTFNKLEKEFRRVESQSRQFAKAAFSVDKVLKNLSTSTATDLKKTLRELNRQMNAPGIKRGSKEYKEYAAQIRSVKEELKSISKEQYSQQGFFSRMSGSAAMSIAAITGVSLSVSDLIEKNNQLEDSASNLKSLTGLDDNAIAYLTDQAKQLSTQATETGMRVRDSADEILNTYTIVGSNKPELLSNEEDLNNVTKYALMLKVASKDISSTSEAAEALAVSLNQYSASADQAERYTNALAASAQKGAANVATQTASLKNAGVAMSQANVSFESSLALIQTLAEKGIKGEVAGTGLKKLFLTLQTGADDTNPKIVGLTTALDNLAKKEMDAAAIKKEFGEEGYNVVSVILSNIDAFKNYEKQITNTNIAVENAAINSNNAAARTAQYKNDIIATGMALTKDLQPALEIGMMSFSGLLKILLLLSPAIKVLTAYMIAYTVAKKAQHLISQRVIQSWLLELATSKQAMAIRYLVIASWSRLTGNITRASAAMKLYNALSIATPWAAITAAVVATGAAVYMLAKHQRQANEEQKKQIEFRKNIVESISGEKTQLSALISIAKNESLSKFDRLKAIKKLNEISPEYLGNLKLENINTAEATKAVNEYTTALERNARAKFAQDEISKLDGDIFALNERLSSAESYKSAFEKQLLTASTADKVYIRRYINMENKTISDINKSLSEINKKRDALKKFVEEGVLSSHNDNSGGESNGGNDKVVADPMKKEMEKLEELRSREMSSFKTQLMNKEITEEEYRKRSEYLDLAHLEQKKAILEKYGQSTTDIYNQILDKYISLQKDAKIGIDIELDPEYSDDDLNGYNVIKEFRESEEGKRAILKSLYDAKLIDFEEYQDRLSEIEEDAEKKRTEIVANAESEKKETREKTIQAIESVVNNAASIVRGIHDRQLQEIESKYARELELAGDNADERAAIEAKMEEEKKELRKKQADIQFVMDIASIGVNTSIAAMRAYADLGPIAGPIAAGVIGALGIVQIAQAQQQREMVKNLWTGGYTDPGIWNEPKGIVHSNEFVGSREAVANPAVRQIFDIVDHAQRNNYVGRLTPNDFITALDYQEGPNKSAIQLYRNNENSYPDKDRVYYTEIANALNRVSDKLEQPIKAYTTITGPGGSDDANKLFDKLNNNSKR